MEITEHTAVEDYDALLDGAAAATATPASAWPWTTPAPGTPACCTSSSSRPDFIKIDLSLVRDIHLDPGPAGAASPRSCSFARTVDAVLVAEGVEQQAELDMLVTLGVRQMQGYLLCAPCANPPTTGFRRPSRHVGRIRGAIPA